MDALKAMLLPCTPASGVMQYADAVIQEQFYSSTAEIRNQQSTGAFSGGRLNLETSV